MLFRNWKHVFEFAYQTGLISSAPRFYSFHGSPVSLYPWETFTHCNLLFLTSNLEIFFFFNKLLRKSMENKPFAMTGMSTTLLIPSFGWINQKTNAKKTSKRENFKKSLLLMPRNTSLPIITGREKEVKMRGFKPFLVELKKKKQSYAKITKAFKKKKKKKVLQRKKWLEQWSTTKSFKLLR